MRSFLRHDNDYCHGCPLFRDKGHTTTYIPTDVVYQDTAADGETPQVDILFVGEAPNHIEDSYGQPFAGDTGHEIRAALSKAGLGHSYALANVVRCRPRDVSGNNRPPTVEEVAACSHYVNQDIEKLNPKVVVLVGNLAVQTLTPTPEWKGKGAGKLKGQIYRKDGRTHLVTVNPSGYLRSNSGPEKRRFYRHINSAATFLTGETTTWSEKGSVVVLDTLEKFDRTLDFFLNECTNPVAVDCETRNLNKVGPNKIATIQLSASADLAYVIPVDHWDSPFKTKEEKKHIKQGLKRLFSSTKTKFPFWIAHNSQFDTAMIIRHFRIARIAKRVVDTQFLAFLQDENQVGSEDGGKSEFNALRLKDLARELLGFYYYDTDLSDAIAARHGADGGSLWNLSLDRLSEYGGTDAYVTFRLFYYYRRWLTRQGYETALKFAVRWYGRVSHLLTKMSMNGFRADPVQLQYLLSDKSPIISRLEELPKQIYATTQAKKANDILLNVDPRTKGMRPLFGKKPWVLDVNKKSHRIHVFIDSCGLEALSFGKDGTASLDKAFLEEYKAHPIIQMYQEYSGLYKLRSSYLNSIDKILYSNPDNAADGRIHAGFHALRTVTGRLSSSNPNLQQLPKGNPWTAKAAIRSMYAARPGYILVECDYGQAEVRWWAQISGDHQYAALFKEMKALREEYKRTGDKELGKKVKAEADIHKKVASIMFKKSVYEVTKDERQRAKALCVVKGTWVRTDLGLEKIEDVVARFNGIQKLETREGAENATKTWHLEVPKTYTLKTSRGYELSGRPEHPVLVWRDTKLTWVELQHLLSTDHVVIRRDANLWPSKEIQLQPYVWSRDGQSGYMPNGCLFPSSLTPDLGRLCGYLTAEADCTNEANIQFVNKNESIVHDFERILIENFGTGFSKILNDDGCWAITLNASISRFLRENSLAEIATSHTKQIPAAILKSPREVLSEYVRGYWAGDGCTGSACKALTASSDLAHQLQMVLLDLGVVTTRSVDYRVTSVGEGYYWTVAATGKDASHFMQVLPPLREGTFVQPKWFSSNIDNIPGLQLKIRAFRKENPYLKGSDKKYSGQRKYPSLPWTSAKEISTSFARENQETLLSGLQSRDSILAKDISEILSKNWYLDSIEAVTSIVKENQEVYDFTIPGSHSFVSQGLISHNCFGCIFGQASKTLAAILGISHEEAIELQDLFIQEFEKAGRWLTDIETQARLTGIVTTPFGRRRHLADLYEIDDGAGNRRARNSPIQASSSDTTALAAWRIQTWIEDNNKPYEVINCVHDAITLEVPMNFDMVKEVVALFSEMMVDSIPDFLKQEFNIDMIVPMEIDFDLGVRWGHMLGYDGVESSLRPIFDKCEAWDKELIAGTPWNEIALRESCFQDPEKLVVAP